MLNLPSIWQHSWPLQHFKEIRILKIFIINFYNIKLYILTFRIILLCHVTKLTCFHFLLYRHKLDTERSFLICLNIGSLTIQANHMTRVLDYKRMYFIKILEIISENISNYFRLRQLSHYGNDNNLYVSWKAVLVFLPLRLGELLFIVKGQSIALPSNLNIDFICSSARIVSHNLNRFRKSSCFSQRLPKIRWKSKMIK